MELIYPQSFSKQLPLIPLPSRFQLQRKREKVQCFQGVCSEGEHSPNKPARLYSLRAFPQKIPSRPPSFRGCWGRGKNLLHFPLEKERRKKKKQQPTKNKTQPSLPAACSEWEVRLVFPAWRSLEVARLRLGCEEAKCFLWHSGGTRQGGHLGALLFPGTSAGLRIRCEEIPSGAGDWRGGAMYYLQKSTWR